MAQRATLHSTGHTGRMVRWFVPSRHPFVACAAIEVVAVVLGLPLVVHVALGVVAHAVTGRHRRA